MGKNGQEGTREDCAFMKAKQLIRNLFSDDMILQLKKLASSRNNNRMYNKNKQIHAFDHKHYPQGINLIGDIKAETGLGQSVRILASIMDKGNIPFIVRQWELHGNLQRDDNTWNHKIQNKPEYAINLIHIIPETWATDYAMIDNELLDYRYNIAYWLWELEDFPDRWLPCIQTVDEIWTPSEFISRSIRKKTDKPVLTVPYAIEMESKEYLNRDYFGLPRDKFLYLTMYDFISISERKNPQAVIEAYIQAFPIENKDVGLVVKVNHIDEKQLADLRKQLARYKNIFFIIDNLTRSEVDSLLNACDVLVSLHRSEGFGLPVAEAMALGKPVIATNWSATTEFMDDKCACLVDYKLIRLEKSIGPYEKGNYWADADVEHAAYFMKKLLEDIEFREEIEKNAVEYINKHLTYGQASDIMKQRMKEIYEKNCIC